MRRRKDGWAVRTLLRKKLVDKEQSYRWLKFVDIKGETEKYGSGSSGSGRRSWK
jgi:hypothetical protein